MPSSRNAVNDATPSAGGSHSLRQQSEAAAPTPSASGSHSLMQTSSAPGWPAAPVTPLADVVTYANEQARQTGEALRRQVIDRLQQTNQSTLDVLGAWAEGTARLVPAGATVPFADLWRDSTLASLGFLAQILDAQRDFTDRVYAALAPLAGDRR